MNILTTTKTILNITHLPPRPLMRGDIYKIDDELSALLIEAHRNIGFLEVLLKYAPNKDAFSELMLLKECTYSLMIDYDGPAFQEVLVNRGSGKEDIVPITNLVLAYKTGRNMKIFAPSLSKLCGIARYGDNADQTIDVRNRQIFLYNVRTNIKFYNPTAPTEVLPALTDISAYLYNDQDTDPLVKSALMHYQFEIIHPFEQYNGIIGRIIIPMILHDIIGETFSFNSTAKAIDLLQEEGILANSMFRNLQYLPSANVLEERIK